MDRVKVLEEESKKAAAALAKEERELQRLEEQLTVLNAKYERAMKEHDSLQEETDILQKRLLAADTLISGLSSENERWQEDLENLSRNSHKMIGDCLLSASFLAYCGPFSFELRNKMIYDDWQGHVLEHDIPTSRPFQLETQLSDDVEMSK